MTLKVRRATVAIDCMPPPTYSHLTIKRKKLQMEKERIWRIEDENRRLLSRLAEIMNRASRSSQSGTSGHSDLKRCTSGKTNETARPEDTNEIKIKRRPHTVAVAQRHRNVSQDKRKILCGCKSRQLALKSEANIPLTIDMADLLCGIQSVEITTKTSHDNLNQS